MELRHDTAPLLRERRKLSTENLYYYFIQTTSSVVSCRGRASAYRTTERHGVACVLPQPGALDDDGNAHDRRSRHTRHLVHDLCGLLRPATGAKVGASCIPVDVPQWRVVGFIYMCVSNLGALPADAPR